MPCLAQAIPASSPPLHQTRCKSAGSPIREPCDQSRLPRYPGGCILSQRFRGKRAARNPAPRRQPEKRVAWPGGIVPLSLEPLEISGSTIGRCSLPLGSSKSFIASSRRRATSSSLRRDHARSKSGHSRYPSARSSWTKIEYLRPARLSASHIPDQSPDAHVFLHLLVPASQNNGRTSHVAPPPTHENAHPTGDEQ